MGSKQSTGANSPGEEDRQNDKCEHKAFPESCKRGTAKKRATAKKTASTPAPATSQRSVSRKDQSPLRSSRKLQTMATESTGLAEPSDPAVVQCDCADATERPSRSNALITSTAFCGKNGFSKKEHGSA